MTLTVTKEKVILLIAFNLICAKKDPGTELSFAELEHIMPTMWKKYDKMSVEDQYQLACKMMEDLMDLYGFEDPEDCAVFVFTECNRFRDFLQNK